MKSLLLVFVLFLSAEAFGPRPPMTTVARHGVTVSRPPLRPISDHGSVARPLWPFKKKADATLEVEEDTNEAEDEATIEEECVVVEEEELTETQKLLAQVKDAGTAGVISYALWELGFWLFSIPVVVGGYYEVTGYWPDLSNKDDMAKLGAEAFAFVNFARFAVPLRIGLALSTTPWIQANIVDRFMKKEDECIEPETQPEIPEVNGDEE